MCTWTMKTAPKSMVSKAKREMLSEKLIQHCDHQHRNDHHNQDYHHCKDDDYHCNDHHQLGGLVRSDK